MFSVDALAANLKKQRVSKGMKQYELAELLHITPQSISKWEQGISVPDLENLCALSELYSVSIDELLGHRLGKEQLMVAVDGGGTKTEFVLFSTKGNIKQRIILEGSNPNVCGIEKACDILKLGIDSLFSPESEICRIYCGLAGFLSGNNGEKITRFLKQTYPKIPINCGGDILNVAASVTNNDRCIAAICGTGSNVCGIIGDKLCRVGGWGYLFDNAGSGFNLGRDAISAALADNDGIGEKTLLTTLIEKRLGTTVWNSINRIYAEDKSYIASFSAEVFEGYECGDKIAKEIIERNMAALTDKINYVSEKYDCGNTVVISGGLMSRKDILLKFIEPRLNKGLEVVIPELPQIFGACVLSCKYGDINIANFKEIFFEDYQRFVNGGY